MTSPDKSRHIEVKDGDRTVAAAEVMPLEQVARGVEQLAKKEGNPIRLVVAP